MNVDKEIRRVVKAEAAIEERDRRLADIQAEQDRARDKSIADKEQLVFAILRKRGVFGLPVSQLLALLARIEMPCSPVGVDIVMSAPPLQTETIREPAAAAQTNVTVRISRNAADGKRNVLIDAGLKWNGKAGSWGGLVDRARLAELWSIFGERVTISRAIEQTAASTAALPSEAAIDRDPQLASESLLETLQGVSASDVRVSSGEAGQEEPPSSWQAAEMTASLVPAPLRLPMRPLPRLPGR
jgi:hypothetical protein